MTESARNAPSECPQRDLHHRVERKGLACPQCGFVGDWQPDSGNDEYRSGPPVGCDFCPRPGRLVRCACIHEHIVGVNVCGEKHADWLGTVEIACRICYELPQPGPASPHVCALYPLPSEGQPDG